MQILWLLLPISLVLLTIAAACFLWAVKRHQFDDLDRAALQILDDPSEQTFIGHNNAPTTGENDL